MYFFHESPWNPLCATALPETISLDFSSPYLPSAIQQVLSVMSMPGENTTLKTSRVFPILHARIYATTIGEHVSDPNHFCSSLVIIDTQQNRLFDMS